MKSFASPYQIRRQDLTGDEWGYLDRVVFPLINRLKAKARQRMAAGSNKHDTVIEIK